MMEDAENLCKAIDSCVSAAQEIRQKAVEEFASSLHLPSLI